MNFLSVVASILLFIVSLGMLITIHELGHLSMAKLFKVYCHEFSIGFGPALLKKRGKGKETYFSIRAIPLGGYVSMYGEAETAPEPELNIPESRSLEGIKKWKKAIVLLAGVTLNAILALVLIGVANIAFPYSRQTRTLVVEESSLAYETGFRNNDKINYLYPDSYLSEDGGIYGFSYQYEDSSGKIHANSFFIVDNNISFEVEGEVERFVLVYSPTGNKGNQVFTEGLSLYYATTGDNLNTFTIPDDNLRNDFISWYNNGNGPAYFPNISSGLYSLTKNTKFTANLPLNSQNSEEIMYKTIEFSTKEIKGEYVFDDIGLRMLVVDEWLPFGDRIKYTFSEFGNSAVAVFEGLGVLFRGGIKNMSGIVGIYSMSSSILSKYTFATYLSLWGLISVNLAIFNLLPFPGLDGWQLVVTIFEGITKKKIPTKAKSIMSLIGFALLAILMIVIVVFDIMAL